ncbi:MAG: serine/threonine protein kinase [Actinomycetia bacterium]|nr:serine/threonine protein kinase [Actinomycetes bacterium]
MPRAFKTLGISGREKHMRDLPLVGEQFAGYRLLSVLGRGGMSIVYRAQHPRLGNVVALKVLAPDLAGDDAFRTRFLEESVLAAGLNHPNVVPVHDSGSSGGLLYLAMRCVTGTDLRQLLGERGRLGPGTAVFLLSQAARALDAAHRGGLVHRDVKPGNLLIEHAADEAEPDHVYLTDFGIAKHARDDTGLNATGQFIGTADYISPEQVSGLPVLAPADQYSLGCVLYECLTGQVPFRREEEAAALWARLNERPPRPTSLRPSLPEAVDEVFMRVLAERPEDRYANCREFTAAAHTALRPLTEPPVPRFIPVGAPLFAGQGGPAELAHEPDASFIPTMDALPQAGKRHRRRAAYAAAALVLAAGLGVTVSQVTGRDATRVALSGRGTALTAPGTRASQSPARSRPSASPSTNMGVQVGNGENGPGTLAGVLAAADTSAEGKNLLPPGKCGRYKQDAGGAVVCTAPVPGVAQVYYQNYSSPDALYSAYKAQVTQLGNTVFRQNTGTCRDSAVSYAEFGWNQEEGHPHGFTVARMASGKVGQMFASGRMACFATRTPHGVSQDIVWTIDNGPAMGVAIGNGPPKAVYQLWASLHHAVLFRGTEMCGTAGRMNASDIPAGNLKVIPVCPPGVEALPASSPDR